MDKFNKLDEYEKLKIEEKAINLLIKEQNIDISFILKTKEKIPEIYKSMIKTYLKQLL